MEILEIKKIDIVILLYLHRSSIPDTYETQVPKIRDVFFLIIFINYNFFLKIHDFFKFLFKKS